MVEIRLPQYGMGMTDGTITVWRKAEGDCVTKGEVLCDIESAKTMVEMESPESGVLRRIVVKVDENVPVNTVIAEMEVFEMESRQETAHVSNPFPGTNSVAGRASAPTAPGPSPAAAGAVSREPNVQIEPAARREARELGVDVAKVVGSGPGGRIVLKDVQTFANAPLGAAAASASGRDGASKSAVQAAAPGGESSTAPPAAFTESVHTMTRRTIARRLTESKQQVPHFYVKGSCAVDALHALRKELSGTGGAPLSINDLIVRAVALTLVDVSEMNVSWGEKAMQMHPNVDVAVAVATPRGLVTPIVRKAHIKTVRDIASELKDLVNRSREGKLRPEEYNGGTVTVSNMGMLAVEEFSAIINPPQAAIFAIGSAEQRPVVRGGKLEIATMMTVTISVDHRAVDGAVAARGLAAFKSLVEAPARLVR
jgi:pyruvate dehydrogenase E2 component (dihydrolipoamide acetyltransferase)